MAKWCPEKQNYALYLDCKECEDKTCESTEDKGLDLKSRLLSACPFPQVFDDLDVNKRPKSEIGYFRADHDGYRWWNTVWPAYHKEHETPELIAEFDMVYEAFTESFPTFTDMKDYCFENAEPTGNPTEFNAYLELEHGWYWLRLITRPRDYNLYLHCYSKRNDTAIIS